MREQQVVSAGALSALTKLVAAEYPKGLTLSEIATTWGSEAGLSEAEIASLVALDARDAVAKARYGFFF